MKACTSVGIPAAVCSDLPENIDSESREIMIAGGITPLQGLDSGLDAIANACRYGLARKRLSSDNTSLEFKMLQSPAKDSASRIVDEWQGKQRLKEHGVEVPAGQLVDTDAIDSLADKLQYPLVLKAVSAELPHKSELGAVKVNLQNADQLRSAVDAMRKSISQVDPDIVLRQFLIEAMVEDVIAELMIGVNTDPQFGQLLVIASGGVLVELTRDVKTLLLPASDSQIRDALQALKCYRMLRGFRGKPGADLELVVATIRKLASFAADHQHNLIEMDINPLMVTSGRCVAADVMIRETL
jgi:acyl-CoA synthetase (NDP forming)